VNVFGNDLDALDSEARQVSDEVRRVRGATAVQVQSPSGTPQVVVRLKPFEVARWGFDPVDVMEAVATAYRGAIVGQVYEGNRVFDVSVILAPDERQSASQIGGLPLRSPNGNYVALKKVADIYETSGRYIVLHEGARRVQTITCNVAGRDVGSFVAEAQNRL
jgi:Cu/Ag efflux pump CusA